MKVQEKKLGNGDERKMTDDSKRMVESTLKQTSVNPQPSTVNPKKAGFKQKREFEMLEKEIAALETEKQQIGEKLSNAGASFEQLNLLSKRIGEIDDELSVKEMRWLELSEIV